MFFHKLCHSGKGKRRVVFNYCLLWKKKQLNLFFHFLGNLASRFKLVPSKKCVHGKLYLFLFR